MSRGLGRIEARIVREIEGQRAGRFDEAPLMVSSWTLACLLTPPRPGFSFQAPSRTLRKAVVRAMHSVVRKLPRYGLLGGQGRRPLYLYDREDPRSRHFS